MGDISHKTLSFEEYADLGLASIVGMHRALIDAEKLDIAKGLRLALIELAKANGIKAQSQEITKALAEMQDSARNNTTIISSCSSHAQQSFARALRGINLN